MKPLEITPHERVYNLEGGHSDSVTCLAFSSKADLLASGSDDGSVVLWSLAKGLRHRSFKVKSPVMSLIWHLHRSRFLICGSQTGVTLYDLLTDKCMPALPGLTGYVDCIDIDQEAGTMAVGIDSNVHVAKEVVDKRYAAFIQLPSPKSLNQDRILWSLHFLGDANKVIVAYAFHGLTCWDVMTETALWRMDPEQFIMPIASTTLSRDGKTILVSHAGGLIRLFRLAQSTPLQSFFCETDPKENHPVTAAYLDGDKKVVSGSPAGEVYVWDAISGRHHQTLGHSGDIIQTVASTETNKYSLIATGNAFKGEKTRVVLWRASVKTAHRESMIIKAWTRLV
ncbi:WD40-repeat-containing domain protein [Amylostereum chailletii]|nr:WD40-repeat-containing domain protein [Amylostereum chailletii]